MAEQLHGAVGGAVVPVASPVEETNPSEDAVHAALERHGLNLGQDAPARILQAVRRSNTRGTGSARSTTSTSSRSTRPSPPETDHGNDEAGDDDAPAVVYVPDFPQDIHDVNRLAWVAGVIAPASGADPARPPAEAQAQATDAAS